jgi:hypothetical protein
MKGVSRTTGIILAATIIFLSACLIRHRAFAAEDFIIKDLHAKVIDSNAPYVYVSFRLDIENSGPPGEIYVTVQGLDKDGFEILTNKVSGNFDRNQSATITDKSIFKMEQFNKVNKWRIKRARKYKK